MTTGAYHLVLSHGYGGGSESFTGDDLFRNGNQGKVRTILATPKWPFLRLKELDGQGHSSKLVTLEWLLSHVQTTPPTSVSINGLSGWVPIRPWLDALAVLPESIVVTLPVHDFLPACPSLHLLDVTGNYCGVPAISTCLSCYPRVSGLYIREFRTIEAWRAAWSGVLERANTVIAFSESSKVVLNRAFPDLRPTVRPHSVALDLRPPQLRLPRSQFVRVAVFGTLSAAKGAAMLVEMAKLAAARGHFTEWHVFGELRGSGTVPSIKLHGRYSVPEMPNLIEEFGIVAAVLPSIVPETFSFVAEELITMGIPFAAFSIGAPFERLQQHPLAHFAEEVTAEALLDATTLAIEAGWQKYGAPDPVRPEPHPTPNLTIPR